jgi:hypothetical protein
VLHSLMFVNGESAEVLLVAYLIAGIATFGAAFLPGNPPLYRVICLMLGGVMAAWATKVMMFGGMLFVNALVLLGPVALLIWGGVGMVRSIASRAPSPARRPHPATRQFGGPASYQPHPPHAYAPMAAPAGYGGIPVQRRPGFADVQFEYPASVPTRREVAAAMHIAHSRRELDIPDDEPTPARHRRTGVS